MRLTEHFTLAELTRSDTATRLGIDNTPPQELESALLLTAYMLERIRARLGAPVVVTSGYRCPRLTAAIGSRRTSDHTRGCAADFIAPAYGTPYHIAKALAPAIDAVGIGQLIFERVGGKSWVHVSTVRPEKTVNRVITISDAGVQAGIQS